MAEFCLDCWNKINGTNDPESKYLMSDEPEFCEECCEMKKVVICYKADVGLVQRFYYFLLREDSLLSRLKSRLIRKK